MSFYPDLSTYSYSHHFNYLNTLNVGWLDAIHRFPKAAPAKWLIEKLWRCSHYSVANTIGFHDCTLPNCPGPFERRKALRFKGSDTELTLQDFKGTPMSAYWNATTKSLKDLEPHPAVLPTRKTVNRLFSSRPGSAQRLYLGSAEIRIFGKRGKIYAAPNLLFHYITAHHYKPPDEFLSALQAGPIPPDPEYFDRLNALGLEWLRTPCS